LTGGNAEGAELKFAIEDIRASLRFGRCDLAIAWKSVDEASSGKELPHAAAMAAMHCRGSGGFADSLFADLVQIPHRLALPCVKPLPGQHTRCPRLSSKQVLCQSTRMSALKIGRQPPTYVQRKTLNGRDYVT
jgi:hypothetical protein